MKYKNCKWREGGLKREVGLNYNNFLPLKKGGLLKRGSLFERECLNRGFIVA